MNKVTLQALALSLGLAACGAWGMETAPVNLSTIDQDVLTLVQQQYNVLTKPFIPYDNTRKKINRVGGKLFKISLCTAVLGLAVGVFTPSKTLDRFSGLSALSASCFIYGISASILTFLGSKAAHLGNYWFQGRKPTNELLDNQKQLYNTLCTLYNQIAPTIQPERTAPEEIQNLTANGNHIRANCATDLNNLSDNELFMMQLPKKITPAFLALQDNPKNSLQQYHHQLATIRSRNDLTLYNTPALFYTSIKHQKLLHTRNLIDFKKIISIGNQMVANEISWLKTYKKQDNYINGKKIYKQITANQSY